MASIAGKTQRTRRGTSRATVKMTDVARMAGVSSMTVSNTFKFPDKVVPETRQKVLDAAKALGYIPNLIAGELASGRSRVVAAITPSIRNSDFADMIMGLEAELNQDGYQLVISVIDRPDREHDAVRTLIGRRVDGIVLTGADRDATTRNLIKKSEYVRSKLIESGLQASLNKTQEQRREAMLHRQEIKRNKKAPHAKSKQKVTEQALQHAVRSAQLFRI